jgi:hypothetical protein
MSYNFFNISRVTKAVEAAERLKAEGISARAEGFL